MQVVLQLETGSHSGQRVVCGPDQRVRVGQTAAADFAVHDDSIISRLHFLIASTPRGAIIQDLASESGTFLNGRRVVEADVADGDQVRAGRSLFRVTFRGVDPPPRIPTARRVREKSFPSKVPSVFGSESVFPLSEAIATLRTTLPLHLAVNLKRAQLPVELAGDSADFFALDELPADLRAANSLSLVSSESPRFTELEPQLRDKDAACYLFGVGDTEELQERFRFVIGWFSRPSILRRQLGEGSSTLRDRLFSCGEVLLCQDEENDGWCGFKNPASENSWQEFGFMVAES